jgi:hypothetical protein
MSIQRIRISNTIKNLIFNKTFIGKFKMKKALLAVLIPSLLGASSAFAGGIDLIKNDDLTLNFNGDIDLKSYVTIKDGESSGTATEVIFDDIDFDITYNINDDLKFLVGVDFTADGGSETADEQPIVTDLIWVGAQTNFGTVKWGNLEMTWDDFGVDTSELDGGRASSLTDGGDTTHENAIRYDLPMGDFVLSATYGIPGEAKADDKAIQLSMTYESGDLEVMAGVGQTTTYTSGVEDDTATYVSIQAKYQVGDLLVGVLFGQESQDEADISTNGVEVDLSYTGIDKVKLSTGLDYLTSDVDGEDGYTYAFVAAKYSFSKLVSLQYEIAHEDGEVSNFSGDKDVTNQIKTGILLNLQF